MSNNNFEIGKTYGLTEVKEEHDVQSSHNNSTNFYPIILNKEKNMGKLASFLTGVIVGAVALGVTACLVDQFEAAEEDSQKSSCTENEDDTFSMSQTE